MKEHHRTSMEIDFSKTVFVEKELLHPVNGEVAGPYFHVFRLDENGNKVELFVEKSGDIKAAVREAERQMDLALLAISYKENPDSFKSYGSIDKDRHIIELLSEEEIAQVSEIIENAKKRSKEAQGPGEV